MLQAKYLCLIQTMRDALRSDVSNPLAPLYAHVFYAPDASASAVLAGRLMSDRKNTEAEEHRKQEELRRLYNAPSSTTPPQDTKLHPFPPESYLRGAFFESIPCRELSIAEVLPYFDWKLFYAIWGVRQPADDTLVGLNEDAIRLLDAMKREGGCRIRIAARFDACHAEDDVIVAVPGNACHPEPVSCHPEPVEGWRLPMLRQEGAGGRSLADFVAPQAYGWITGRCWSARCA